MTVSRQGGFLECSVENAPLEITRKGGFDIVKSPGCSGSFTPGALELPVRHFFVALGRAAVSSFELISVEREILPGRFKPRELGLPTPVSAGPGKGSGAARGAPPAAKEPELLALNSIQERGGEYFAAFSLRAAEYDYSSGRLTRIKKVVFRIELEGEAGAGDSRSSTDGRFVSSFAAGYDRRPSAMPSATDGYLLITNDALMPYFQPLIESHSSKFNCSTITVAEIESSYPGADTQAKIKACIKHFYDSGVRYVLLGGDTEIIPARGVYAKVSGSALKRGAQAVCEDSNIACDLYYADTSAASWDNNNNGVYGEWADGVNFMPGVYIGRAPVSGAGEAENFVRKALYCPLRNNFRELLIADWLIKDDPNGLADLDGKEIMTGDDQVKAQTPSDFEIAELYSSEGTLSAGAVINEINSGIDFLNHSGHGNYNLLDPVFNISNVFSLSNTKPFVTASIGCYAGSFDNKNEHGGDVGDCIGEYFVKESAGGAAFMGNSRYGWFEEEDATKYSGEFMVAFSSALFNLGMTRLGEAFAKSKIDFISQATDSSPLNRNNPYRWIEYSLNLLGDPAMLLPSDKQIDFVSYTLNLSTASRVTPGDANELVVEIQNLKSTDTVSVSASISTSDPYVTVLSSYAFFGDVPPDSAPVSNSTAPFIFSVSADCPSEHIIVFDLLMNTEDAVFYAPVQVSVSRLAPGLSMIYPWPNPVRSGSVHISNIPLDSRPSVSIYNLAGEEVAQLREGDGIITLDSSMRADWDLKNKYGKPAASGVYYYFLRTNIGNAKGKIAVIK